MDYLILAMIVSFVGGVWVFFSKDTPSDIVLSALSKAAAQAGMVIVLIIPALTIIFALIGFYNLYLQRRRKKTEDPTAKTRQPGRPSVLGGTGVKAEERDEHLEGLIAEEKWHDALEYAEEMLQAAKDSRDATGQLRYWKYVEHIRKTIG